MDVYVVQHIGTGRIMGISARLQGAELRKLECEQVNPDGSFRIENHDVRDL